MKRYALPAMPIPPDSLDETMRILFEAGRAYIEGAADVFDLHAGLAYCRIAIDAHGASPQLRAMLIEWREMLERRWNEWGMCKNPLTEEEFCDWLRGLILLPEHNPAPLHASVCFELYPGTVSGKARGYLSGVRPNHYIHELGNTAMGAVSFEGGSIELGETKLAEITYVYWEAVARLLVPGLKYEVREGSRTVGQVEVLAVQPHAGQK